jgi:IS30 family transposase
MEEILRIDKIISPLLKKKQSIHVIMENHKDEIMLDEKTIRNYVNAGLFSAKKTDLLNTVKMRPRKAKIEIKVERACRDGRSYRDFIAFMRENPDTAVVQMDTVEGGRGTAEPVILTIHFVEAELMLAFLREANTAKSVVDVINRICDTLGLEVFRKLFPVVLTDRGSEFSSPSAIEMDANGRARTKLFYTDPGAPYQKGACENNHSLIRRVIPKGRLLSGYSQDDLNLLMNHINSYKRKKLKNRSPIEVFNFLHNDPVICTKLGVKPIAPDDVNLSPSLFRR